MNDRENTRLPGRGARPAARLRAVLFFCAALGAPLFAGAAPVTGEVTEYPAADGSVGRCIRITPMPGADFSSGDVEDEKAYCAIDFETAVLCPKLWSTSPGTIVYQAEAAGGDPEAFERAHCASGHHIRDAGAEKLASFKISVNGRTTSATYAPASWVYYHFSRYLDTNTHVPVAVYRSYSRPGHHERVVEPALKLVAGRRNLHMLAEGWKVLDALETGAADAGARAAALTDDGRQVFGVLLDNSGDRYGAEFNGTRESGWGSGQNYDFQQTAPFLALRSERPLTEAAAAVRDARTNPRMARALDADTPVAQVWFWMRDLMEITLLDYLLGQQDRIGNIDYRWRWYWLDEDGDLKHERDHGGGPPEQAAGRPHWRIRQSAINDNDAGVRRGYANFAERTGMLEGLRHYDPELYRRLATLAADMAAKGEAYRWMTEAAGLSQREADAIAGRTVQAFDLLRSQCEAGTLKLDFDLVGLLSGREARAPGPEACAAGTP